jgi:hypothetical protein
MHNFSEAPVDFMNKAIDKQIKDSKVSIGPYSSELNAKQISNLNRWQAVTSLEETLRKSVMAHFIISQVSCIESWIVSI